MTKSTPLSGQHRRQPSKQLPKALADQAVSSGGNFLLLILAAHYSSPREFGQFAVATTVYALAVGLNQALASEAILSIYPRLDPKQRHVAGALGSGLIVGVSAGTLCIIAGLLLNQHSLVALGIVAPPLMIQDVERHIFLSTKNAGQALMNDSVWTALQTTAFLVMGSFRPISAAAGVLLWGASCAVATLVGFAQLRTRPVIGKIKDHITQTRPYVPKLVGEWSMNNVSYNLVFLLISSFAGVAQAGGVRAATALYSPLNTFYAAIRVVLIPRMSGRVHEGDSITGAAYRTTFLTTVIGFSYVLIVNLLPDSLGRFAFHDSWTLAVPFVLLVGIQRAILAIPTGFMFGLRALLRFRDSLHVRLISGTLTIAAGSAGLAFDSARGSVIGLLIAASASSSLYFAFFEHGRRIDSQNAMNNRPSSSI